MLFSDIKGKVAVYIDAGNLFYVQKTLGIQVDFLKFKKIFPKKTDFYYFTAYNPKKSSQMKFFSWLATNGYTLVTRKLEYARYGLKGNVDTEITLHLATEGLLYQSIILLSGDGDFVPVVHYLRKHDKTVYTLSTKGHMKESLLKSTRYTDLATYATIIRRDT
jgi:uncharacterized LabA/DUF88 family protein